MLLLANQSLLKMCRLLVKYLWVSLNVSNSLVFYIPDPSERGDDDEKRKLRTIIEKYGGMLSEFHECFTYQIELISDPLTPKHFFQGEIY